MGQIEWDDFRLTEPKRSIDWDWFRPNVAEKAMLAFEGVLKNTSQVVEGPLGGIDRHGLVFHLTESAEIVETENMISVRMRINHSVNSRDRLAQTLRAKIRRRIHLNDHLRRSHLDCAAQTFVSRINRGAHVALAADHRDSVRRACAKKRNFNLPHCDPFMA